MRSLPLQYALRNLGRSHVRLAASLLGSTLVVLLLLASMGFVRGMQRTLIRPDGLHTNIILLGTGSEEAIERSQVSAGLDTIAAASIRGLKQRAGVVFASPEIHMALPVRASADDPTERQAVLRGVRPVALLVHPDVEIIEGRMPRAAQNEIMVGSLAATRLGLSASRLAIGSTIHFDRRDWTVVGRFHAGHGHGRRGLDPSDRPPGRLATRGLDLLRRADARHRHRRRRRHLRQTRLDLEIAAIPEREYYASIGAFYRPIRVMVVVTAILIAVGGILGGLNTMYAAFAARVREVGMLQALGFTRAAIVLSLTQESVFASACGAIIASGIALAALDGLAVRFSMGAFALRIDSATILAGLVGGLCVGLIGAIPPAIRCLHLPIAQALKSH